MMNQKQNTWMLTRSKKKVLFGNRCARLFSGDQIQGVPVHEEETQRPQKQ